MDQSLEEFSRRKHGWIVRGLSRSISPGIAESAERWAPGLWFAALQRSSGALPLRLKPWLIPSLGSAILGSCLGIFVSTSFFVGGQPRFVIQIHTLITLTSVLPAFCWHLLYSRSFFQRLLDQSTFEQLMTTPLGSVAVLKDTILHLALLGAPVYAAGVFAFFLMSPWSLIVLVDYTLYVALFMFISGGAGLGVQLALHVPLSEQERVERRAKHLAALRHAVVRFCRLCRQFGIFAVRILLPLAAIAGVGWTVGITVHPALGWLVAMFGGMAFIVTLLIVATAKQIGTPMPPLPPLPEPGFKDLWEDRLRRYFDREVSV